LPVRFRVPPQEVEVVVKMERQSQTRQQQQQQQAAVCPCDLSCTHSGIWERDWQLASVPSPSSATTAAVADAARRGTAATCDDGRGMKWTNTCENSCCRPRAPITANCLNHANVSLLVLGFSHERTLWFDMMYRSPCNAPCIFVTM
jgi:hypothetical protein